jgi:hypothetical protein
LERGKQTLFATVQVRKSTCALMSRISPLADKTMGIMETLFAVFRASIEEMNEDKEHFSRKLKMYNDMGEALSEYLKELNDVMNEGGVGKEEEPDPETATLIVGGIERAIRPLSVVLGRMQQSPLYAKAELRKQLQALKLSLDDITRVIKRPPKPRFKLRRGIRRP